MASHTQSYSRSGAWRLAAAAVLSAAVLTLIFAHALAAYWHFYHLGTPGTGFFLVLFVLPGGLALAINVVFVVARGRLRRGASPFRGVTRGVLAAGNLAPYLFHHVGVGRSNPRGAEVEAQRLLEHRERKRLSR